MPIFNDVFHRFYRTAIVPTFINIVPFLIKIVPSYNLFLPKIPFVAKIGEHMLSEEINLNEVSLGGSTTINLTLVLALVFYFGIRSEQIIRYSNNSIIIWIDYYSYSNPAKNRKSKIIHIYLKIWVWIWFIFGHFQNTNVISICIQPSTKKLNFILVWWGKNNE